MNDELITKAAVWLCLHREGCPTATMNGSTMTNLDFAKAEIRSTYRRLEAELAIKCTLQVEEADKQQKDATI